MRTTDERIELMHRRAAEISKASRHRKALIAQAAVIVIGIVVVAAAALAVPEFNNNFASGNGSGGMYASIFSDSPVLGYIAVGVIAFLLGTAVTVLCFRIRKWEQTSNTEGPYGRDSR